MNYEAYYTALGQLVYAIAMADGSIQYEEKSRIFKFVISQLYELEKETGNGKRALMAFNIEKEFHRLKDSHVSLNEASRSFLDFVENNKEDIDEETKSSFFGLMEKVAEAYNGIEESEREQIEMIKKHIDNL
jgi:uncharacterized tellurite resistance protein B-like protein